MAEYYKKNIYSTIKGRINKLTIDVKNHWKRKELTKLNETL